MSSFHTVFILCDTRNQYSCLESQANIAQGLKQGLAQGALLAEYLKRGKLTETQCLRVPVQDHGLSALAFLTER